MRCVKRTIDIGNKLTKFIRFQKSDGTILFSSIPSIVTRPASSLSHHKSDSNSGPDNVTIFGQQYLVGSSPKGKLNQDNILSNRKYFFEHYMAMVSSAISRMDETIIDELVLTAPLSRITWLQNRISSFFRTPVCYPGRDPIIVKKFKLVPSCYGSYLNHTYHTGKNSRTYYIQYMLIDIGYRLTEWLPVNVSRPNFKHSGFMNLSHNQNNNSSLPRSDINRLLQRIIPIIKQSCVNAILLTGGGASKYEKAIRNIVNGLPVITAPDNIYANVLGYQRNLGKSKR